MDWQVLMFMRQEVRFPCRLASLSPNQERGNIPDGVKPTSREDVKGNG